MAGQYGTSKVQHGLGHEHFNVPVGMCDIGQFCEWHIPITIPHSDSDLQAVQTFAQMAALRLLLAVFEACIVPGLVLTTVSFYKPTEVPMRTALWTLANTLLPIPFSVIYYGFAKLPSEPLEQWR